MLFKRRSNTDLILKLSKREIFIGVFIGLSFSFIFYFLIQLFKKTIIILDALIHDYELYFLPKEEMQFYNFFYAFIAIFFGYTIVLNYFLDKPIKFLSKYNYKRKSILNQQRLTNWFFLSWFFRMAIIISFFALDYDGFVIYPDYSYIIVLIVLTLFGQIWISMRYFFKRNKLKSFFIVLLITASFSFGLSQINILNEELIDKNILSNNDLYTHNVHVVESNVSIEIKHKSLILDIVIPDQTKVQMLIVEGEEIEIKDFEKSIFKFWNRISEAERPYVNYTLFIDRNVEMKLIDELKQRLIKIKGRRIYYASRKTASKAPFYYKSNQGLGIYLQRKIFNDKVNESKEVRIKILEKGNYFFNDKTINKDKLSKEIKNYFQKNGVKSFRIYMDNSTKFHEYFEVLENSKKVVDDIRNQYSRKSFGIDYVNLNRKQRQFLREKYRWQIIDEIML